MSGKKMILVMTAVIMVLMAVSLFAVVPKKPQSTLDDLIMVSERFRVPQNVELIDNLRGKRARIESLSAQDLEFIKNFDRLAEGWDEFLTRNGGKWDMLIDTRTGLPALVEGSGEPWIPGKGNNLRGESFGKITVSKIEKIARDFMVRNSKLFPISQEELVLVPEGTVEHDGYFWHVQFQYVKNGIPVEGARVVFRVNNGNLVQFGIENVNPYIYVDTTPSISEEVALSILESYIGGFDEKDEILEKGKLLIVPFRVDDDGKYEGIVGKGLEYRLVYEIVFHREGILGTWKARIDAHTGEILSFIDENYYGTVMGGIYPNSNLDTEVIRPFPKITVTNSTTKTCDMGGNYSYTSGTATASIKGQYVTVSDSCGTSSLSTSTAPGDLNFSKSSGTDCTTPGIGGAGNTHAARSTYFHLTLWKERALGFLPSNTWLSASLTDKVNLSQTCNAYWSPSGGYVAFFKSGGGCSNTGELPTVFLHEAGHGLDSNDGSGSSSVGSSESYGDAMAFLQTHDSCIGTNFIPGYKCTGYGDACTTCTGIRDADYAKHSSGQPHKPSMLANTTGYHCPTSSSYYGPCGYEGHCESYIMSEVLWDLAARDLPASGLDANTSWYIADRLFYLSRASSTEAYSCPSITSSNGCGTGNWFATFRAVDDDDGNLSNGTPHGGAIFNAFNRHVTACTSVSGYNTTYSAYATPTKPTLTATAGQGQVTLSWTASTNATKYTVLRNEMGSNYGMMVIATTTSTSYTDTQVAPGITYYYAIAPVGSSNSTIGPLSDVKSATPTSGSSTTYSISGTVTYNGSGLSGVTMTLSGAASATTTTGTDGSYTFSGLANGTYTVTPSKSGYTFSPTSISVTISGANQTGKNFTASTTSNVLTSGVPVSGSVAYQAWAYYQIVVPSGASQLTVTLTNLSADIDLYDMAPSTAGGVASNPTTSSYTGRSWNSGTTNETLTHSNPIAGTWAIGVYGYAAGSYTLTATVTTTQGTYSISGKVTLNGSGLSGVTITAGSASTTTATDGTYTISGLANGTYTVTPSKSGYTFSPTSYSVTINGANVTGKDFTATASSGTTTNILQSPGFETSTGWTWTYSGTSHTWRTTSTTPVGPHSGSYKAQLCSYTSTYYNSQTEYLKQTVTIPSTATAATLNFWYYIKTAETTTTTAYDKLEVLVQNTSGTTLATLTTLSNLNKTSAWTQKTGLNLLSYKGQTIVLVFKASTDSSYGTMFMLDDIELNVTQ